MSDTTVTTTNAGAIAVDSELREIQSFEDAIKLLESLGAIPESASDYGTGFKVVDKDTLVGVPMVLIQWRFNPGAYGEDFVSVEAVTQTGDKVIFNDGSTGICAQLRGVTNDRAKRGVKGAPLQAGLGVPEGLTMTTYFYNETTKATSKTNPGGKDWKPAHTFYLAGA